jgi:phenylacetic acid degradation operon negative regulatory protein
MCNNTATEIMDDFRKAYPLSVKGSVYNFLILRDGAPFLAGLPYPSLSTIRDFALYAGTSDSAIRTLLSRAGKAGYIRKEKDEAGTMRYRLSEPSLVLSMVNSRQSWLPEGFIVAVFSFTVDATSERSIVRETLKNFGFKKIAQNVYLNGRIDTGPLRAAMRELGLDSHLYLFQCSELEDEVLIRRVNDLFELGERSVELAAFEAAMLAFIDCAQAEASDRDEAARRLIYAGLVFWERFKTTEPPLPAWLLPEGYRFGAIARAYDEHYAASAPVIAEYYARISAR